MDKNEIRLFSPSQAWNLQSKRIHMWILFIDADNAHVGYVTSLEASFFFYDAFGSPHSRRDVFRFGKHMQRVSIHDITLNLSYDGFKYTVTFYEMSLLSVWRTNWDFEFRMSMFRSCLKSSRCNYPQVRMCPALSSSDNKQSSQLTQWMLQTGVPLPFPCLWTYPDRNDLQGDESDHSGAERRRRNLAHHSCRRLRRTVHKTHGNRFTDYQSLEETKPWQTTPPNENPPTALCLFGKSTSCKVLVPITDQL